MKNERKRLRETAGAFFFVGLVLGRDPGNVFGMNIFTRLSGCDLCRDAFARTETHHEPRPVVQGRSTARILIAGQAPGMRVYQSGMPFDDASGDRLRDWMGISRDVFYDADLIAIVPMAFCFPGYDKKGADLPPPPICARTWRKRVLSEFTKIEVTLLVGAHAQKWHLNDTRPVSERVAAWRDCGEDVFPLPHPSWRNTSWIRKNPWFEGDVLPILRERIKEVLG